MILTTERLVLRELHAGDAAFILSLLNEPSFIRNIGDRGVRTLEDARGYIAAGPIASYARHGFGLYLVERRQDAEPIGICGLVKRDELPGPDLGFAFLPAYWSQGYARESAKAVQRHASGVLRLPRLLAITNPGNESSIRLLERLGFTFDRLVRLAADGAEVKLFVHDGDRDG
ncbi:MAG TPA: GNAT family N-acetyltransferase [Vicinamibacterales bacterium]|jgi:RimJ/RimL family protein N-acetyltransferase|nr:GNAT family N-acetyltransferase [Vicinamibacterales bacterium]